MQDFVGARGNELTDIAKPKGVLRSWSTTATRYGGSLIRRLDCHEAFFIAMLLVIVTVVAVPFLFMFMLG